MSMAVPFSLGVFDRLRETAGRGLPQGGLPVWKLKAAKMASVPLVPLAIPPEVPDEEKR